MKIFLSILLTSIVWLNVINAYFSYKQFKAGSFHPLKGHELATKIFIGLWEAVTCVGLLVGWTVYKIGAKSAKKADDEAPVEITPVETRPLPEAEPKKKAPAKKKAPEPAAATVEAPRI